jgi:thiamin-phosphate kinase
LGPAIGVDCAVLDFGEKLLVAKSDPITFTAEDIGWYAVHINANDIATFGARPRWFLLTVLLPEGQADEGLVDRLFTQVKETCEKLDVDLIGGHSEVTAALDRTILAGTMLGEVSRDCVVTPQGAVPGDRLLLTKGIPIEGASILAREYASELDQLPQPLIDRARDYLHDPGISILAEALAASQTGAVTAMHDPTEGGLASGLWELAQAANVGLQVLLDEIPIVPEARTLCEALEVNPLEAIASGALLLTVNADRISQVTEAIREAGVEVWAIGEVTEGEGVFCQSKGESRQLRWPSRDSLAELFERRPPKTPG